MAQSTAGHSCPVKAGDTWPVVGDWELVTRLSQARGTGQGKALKGGREKAVGDVEVTVHETEKRESLIK